MLYNKKLTTVIIIILLGAAAVAGAFGIEKNAAQNGVRTTQEYTDEMVLSLPFFDIYVPCDENRGLPADVVSICFGDENIYIPLPDEMAEKSITAYIRDEGGNCLARRVFDLKDSAAIGPWKIVPLHMNLPVLMFESESAGKWERMNNSPDKTDICRGSIALYDKVAMGIDYGKFKAEIKGRGQSSWNEATAKKSYSLKLEESLSILGMGANKKWNLIGCAFDPSLLKNMVFNDLAENMGIEYQPEMEYVDLFVDGRFMGVYLLTTKVTVNENSVALSDGDFFFQMDPTTQMQPIEYESGLWFEDGLDHPVADLLYPEYASNSQLDKASSILQEFMDAMEDTDSSVLNEKVDMESLARYYWIQEATMNFDAWQRSVYMYYRKSDGKLHMGPVWDMDLTLGSPYEKEGMTFDNPVGWKVRNAGWYKALFEREDFRETVKRVYYEGGVREALIESVDKMDEAGLRMGEDAYLNYRMYGTANSGHTLQYGSSYDEYTEVMKAFYRYRLEWIDGEMARFE